jgi:polar amino acid transport system permease protein
VTGETKAGLPGGSQQRDSHLAPVTHWLERLPYWLLAAILLALAFVMVIINSADYREIFTAIAGGLWTTIYVSLAAFTAALILGLLIGLLRVAHNRVLREATSLYVEIIRGLPMLVILYYFAFVGAPAITAIINGLGSLLLPLGPLAGIGQVMSALMVRDLDFSLRAILALTIGYSAFISEIFRAGILSIGRGQMEAARSLGMSYPQAMRFVILPQAIRNVLPPLGNDFIAMLKDSSLVSVLGVQDITQLGKLYSASTFRFFETYNIVGFLYLIMTIGLALLVRGLEKRMSANR